MEVLQLLLVICCIGFPLATSQDYRLPEIVEPSKYEVNLFIPEGVFKGENVTFEGDVTIHFRVTSRTSEIKLHHRVTIPSGNIYLSASGVAIPTNHTYNETTEILTISLSSNLSISTDYELNIIYHGTLEQKNMAGVYISTYKDENNETAYLVTTQFQPTDARHAFPCFDEPQYKATFVISLTYPTGLNALCNSKSASNITDSTVETGYTKTTYQETTVMSTYLIAFIISNFTCTEGDTIETGVYHRICSRDEEKADRSWAVEVGTPLLRTLESMTQIKYGSYMPKMDQVAIPDFSAGAMENWGLVTYRETGLLFSEEDTSNNYKKSIGLVIAHELTHMWFGNLVTCKWWDYTFLNEGFARFYQYFAAAATKQFLDWELEKHFNVEQVQTALLADSSSTAQALTSISASPSQVSAKFGLISYNKGASIYRMIETNIMGADNFIAGIREYLKTYKLTGTVPANLWSSLANHVPSNSLPTDVDLSTVLNNWVELSGHPVVTATKSGDDVILTQERFLLSQRDDRQYYVPITYTVSNDISKFPNTTVKAWLIPDEPLTLSGVLKNSSWIILNNRQSGFYRVNYDNSLWSALKSQLHSNHLAIDVLNRAQIVSDAYNFARSGRNGGYGNWTYTDIMDILSYLEHEEDYYPWYAAIVGNNHLLQRIGYDSEEGQQVITWMLKLMENVYKTVPFETIDSSNQVYSMKQILILTRVCRYGEASCIAKSKELFADYRDKGVKVPKNLRSIVYCNALKHSNDITNDFNFLWQKYTETKLMSEIITILSGLGCTENTELLKWYLGQTINETSGIRLQDFSSVWSYVYSSGKIGTNAALEYISENYDELSASNSSAKDLISSMISNAANYITDADQLTKIQTLINLEGILDSDKAAAVNALNSSQSTITWAASLKQDIKSYFIEDDYEEKPSTDAAVISKSSFGLVLVLVFLLNYLCF